MGAQITRQYLGVAGHYGFQYCVVYEDVLVLGLYHVVPLCTQTRHLTIDIYRVHVLDPLQHRVDYDEGARTTNARTAYINSRNNESIHTVQTTGAALDRIFINY